MTDTSGDGEASREKGAADEHELRKALARTCIGPDLVQAMVTPEGQRTAATEFAVIIEADARFPGGGAAARLALARVYVHDRGLQGDLAVQRLRERGVDLTMNPRIERRCFGSGDLIDLENSFWTNHYLIGTLTRETILQLANWTPAAPQDRSPVYKIWGNHPVEASVFESVRTIKCDAAKSAFYANGEGVVWAVCDTGIDQAHPHFIEHDTLNLTNGAAHYDFTAQSGAVAVPNSALTDTDGHGTHVAGVIAGESLVDAKNGPLRLLISQQVRVSDTQIEAQVNAARVSVAGLAPKCKLVSLKVLANSKAGDVGKLLAAIGYIQQVNSHGGDLKIHGVNMSLGYSFDARWFAAGQSPLCVEVNRLVKSGVVVVVAAGNGGYGTVQTLDLKTERATHLGTINDPGNAELAITVGSTHRDMPHTFGISYFSGKGPTADGRQKPDMVAPGERIVSCARMSSLPDFAAPLAAQNLAGLAGNEAPFVEMSGTSMAAPHVSGAIAAFLSVRREFRGQPEAVKRIFMDSATDLGRRPDFQGAGLIDAMRALQSV